MKAPCYKNGKDCEKRHPNCHSECGEYQKFWKANREENEKRLIENNALAVIRSKREKEYFKKLKSKMKGGSKDG